MSYVKLLQLRLTAGIAGLALILCLFSPARAWTLPVGESEFGALNDHVYVMQSPLSQPDPQNLGFMNNRGPIVASEGLVLIDPGASTTTFSGDNIVNRGLARFEESRGIDGVIAALEDLSTLRDAVRQAQQAEAEDYEIKQRDMPRFAGISHWSELDRQFGPNLNKMFLQLEAFSA